MRQEIEFVGKISGDCECFCWDSVDENIVKQYSEDYEENLEYEIECIQKLNNRKAALGQPLIDIPTSLNRIYPVDIFQDLDYDKKYRFKISVEEIE